MCPRSDPQPLTGNLRPAERPHLYSSPGEAVAGYQALGLDWRLAIAGVVMASTLGTGTPDVRAAADLARGILTRLRAKPMLEALDRAVARESSGVPNRPRSPAPAVVPAP